MSITYSLRRWADPDFQSASEQAQMERVFEQMPAPVRGGLGDIKIFHLVSPAMRLQCRLCGSTGRGDTYCLTCLADTME